MHPACAGEVVLGQVRREKHTENLEPVIKYARTLGMVKPMIIAHISDPHINPDREPKTAALASTVTHLLQLPMRPDVVLVTGDCTDNGTRDEYALFKSLIQPLPMPVYVIPGNHDHRAIMLEEFGSQGSSPLPGFMQYVVDSGPVRLIALDTHIPGESGGLLDSERLQWLEDRLGEAPERPTLIFMHHPPLMSGLQVMDSIGLQGTEEFQELVGRFSQVQRVVAGHTHMTLTQAFGGSVVMTCPGVDHALLPDLSQPEKLVVQLQSPMCLLHIWDERWGMLTYTSAIGHLPLTTLHDGERWV